MYAAVVESFAQPPRYRQVADPEPVGDFQERVRVLAAGLSPRVRSQADGSHYTATDELPLIPGIDGVAERSDGSLVYFVLPDTVQGAMAEFTVIDARRSVALPDGADPVLLAAAMNPAMSSWLALTRRVSFQPGQSVLILGATGSAGRIAVQVARHLGASTIVAAGRNTAQLATLGESGATVTLDLSADPAARTAAVAAAAEADVVLDYLWGPPAEQLLMPLLTARTARARPLSWVQIGSAAGPTLALPSAVLRQAAISFVGSGQGSVGPAGILAELPGVAAEISRGTLHIDAAAHPLADVETVWTAPTDGRERVVLVP